MKKVLTYFLTTLTFSTLVSCGGSQTELEIEIPSNPNGGLAMLHGTWNAPCYSDVSQQQVFSGDNFTTTMRVYNTGSNCGTLHFTTEYKGTYSAAITYQPAAGDEASVDWTYYILSITPASAGAANTLNSSSYCSLTNWSSGVAQSVAGRTCGSTIMPTYGQIKYTTAMYYNMASGSFAVGDLLFSYAQAGSPVDGSTPAKRTIVYDGDYHFRK